MIEAKGFEELVLEKLERIAAAQERNAADNAKYTAANVEFQRSLVSVVSSLMPAILAMCGQMFQAPQMPKVLQPINPLVVSKPNGE